MSLSFHARFHFLVWRGGVSPPKVRGDAHPTEGTRPARSCLEFAIAVLPANSAEPQIPASAAHNNALNSNRFHKCFDAFDAQRAEKSRVEEGRGGVEARGQGLRFPPPLIKPDVPN